MKKITFKRAKESFNQGISYKIFIDENKLTELNNGEKKTIEIPKEFKNLSIKAKMYGWWGSKRIDLKSLSANETVNIKGNKFLNVKSIFIVLLLPLTGPLMFGYGRDYPIIKNIGIILFIVLIAFAIGILVIWKNRWLEMKTE